MNDEMKKFIEASYKEEIADASKYLDWAEKTKGHAKHFLKAIAKDEITHAEFFNKMLGKEDSSTEELKKRFLKQ